VQDPLVIVEQFEKRFLGGFHLHSVSNKVSEGTNLLRKERNNFKKPNKQPHSKKTVGSRFNQQNQRPRNVYERN